MEDWNGGNGAKVYIDGLYPRFEEGELVRINGGTYVIESIGNDGWGNLEWVSGKDSDNPPFYSVYPNATAANLTLSSTSTVTVNLPQRQYYQTVKVGSAEYQKLKAPMCAYAPDGYQLTFKNVCSVAHIQITNNSGDTRYIDSIDVIADNVQLCGTMTVTDFGTQEPKVVAPTHSESDDLNWVRLYGIGGAGGKRLDVDATADYYIYLPSYSTNTKLTIKVYENSHGFKYKVDAVQPVSRTLERNVMFTVNFGLSDEEKDGFTPVTGGGGFTVRMANGKPSQKVYLGYGNVFHNNTTEVQYEEWFIAPFQYDMVAKYKAGTNSSFVASDYNDLFYLSQGTSNDYGSVANSSYSFANFVDWAELVDPQGKGWRTLSGDEWMCLIEERPNHASLFGYATIGSIPTTDPNRLDPYHTNTSQVGCIFLPDEWDWSNSRISGLQSKWNLCAGKTAFTNATFSYAEWLLLEEAGAIFIPWHATPASNNRVSYWISSATWNPSDNEGTVYNLCFHNNSLGGIHNHGTDPCFVRLAINVELVDVVPPADESSKGSKRKGLLK